jgi:ubiquitin carboxyl-terminal hydrolase 40
MTPELRHAIFDLPLCVDTPQTPSDFLPESPQRQVVYALQELFAKLQMSDQRALSTRALTDSFNWTGADVVVQQDVQELNKVMFDVIEQSLASTQHASAISRLYRGVQAYQTICMNCASMTEREEVFSDVNVQVKGSKSLVEGLRRLTTYEDLTGDNQYFCEVCQMKTDAKRGMQLKQLPPILTFSLSRFEYDYERDERKKISTKVAYPLELDLQEFVPTAPRYELFAVIIHGGSAFGGHYHAFIRDVLSTGTWEIDPDVTEEPKDFPELAFTEPPKDKSVDFEDFRVSNKKNRKRLKKVGQAPAAKAHPDKASEIFPEECLNSGLHTHW